jgi:6,7-dimethyl-8-ribityllumazine synthase
MSREGAPGEEPVEGAQPLRVVIVAAQWHTEITDGLLAGAHRALADSQVRDVRVVRVPGAFELPVAAARIAHGAVCNAATDGLTQVSITTGIPIGFGVLTCDTEDQARDRAGLEGSREDKGYEATQAALLTAIALVPYHRQR